MCKKINMIIVAGIMMLLTISCNQEVKFENKEINSMVSLDIPNYLTPQDIDNPDASLEYGNLFKEHYIC